MRTDIGVLAVMGEPSGAGTSQGTSVRRETGGRSVSWGRRGKAKLRGRVREGMCAGVGRGKPGFQECLHHRARPTDGMLSVDGGGLLPPTPAPRARSSRASLCRAEFCTVKTAEFQTQPPPRPWRKPSWGDFFQRLRQQRA